MDETIKLYLFGPPQLVQNNHEVSLGRRHSLALIAYLAIENGPHAREEIAAFLWPGKSRDQAQTSLRSTLPLIRKHLGAETLVADRKTIALTPDARLWVDVLAFQKAVATTLHHHSATHSATGDLLCPDCARRLQRAVALFGGGFMAGFSFSDHPDYSRWQVYWQQTLLRQLGTAMTHLSQYQLTRHDQELALATIKQWLVLDPYNEVAHRQLMLLYQEIGQRPLAIHHYQTFAETLQSDLNLSPEAETTALYEAIRKPLQVASSPLSSPPTNQPSPIHNLPPPLNRFLGRETEIREIAERLDKPECRLLTISGLGGIGKSRLAVEIGRLFLPLFADGVHFVPLATIEEPELIIPTIADALNFSFYSQDDVGKQLKNYLREKEMLLIVDNFEQVMVGKTLLLELLQAAPRVKFLVTSRESLNLQAEWLYELEGLPYPRQAAKRNGQSFTAVQLFIERAKQAHKKFSMTPEIEACVHQMCQFVNGIPLAIELLAPLVKIHTCEQIIRDLQIDTDILATTRQDIPARHRSMRTVFTQSWQLLSANERTVLKKLAIFRGSFDFAAAASVTGATRPVLESLLNKSLIRQPTAGRFELHEFIKQYVWEQLTANETEMLADRHSQYFANFLAKRTPVLHNGTGDLVHVLPEISQEIDNVRAAWNWIITHEQEPIIEQVMEPLFCFYRSRGWQAEGYEVFTAAMEQLTRVAAEVNTESSVRQILICRLMAYRAWFCCKLANYMLAEKLTDEALVSMVRVKDKQTLAFLWFIKGTSKIFNPRCSWEIREIREMFQHSHTLYQELNDSIGVADCLNNLAITYSNEGDFEAAKGWYRQAIVICEKNGYLEQYARIINNLGVVYEGLGEYQEAVTAYKTCFDVCQQLQTKMGMAVSLINQGDIALKTGHYQKAKELCLRQMPIMRDIGDRFFIIMGLMSLGHAHYMLAEYRDAWQALIEGMNIALAIESKPVIAQVFSQIARLFYHLQRFESSFALLTASESQTIIATHSPGTPENLHELLVDKISEEKRLEIQELWRGREHHEVALFVQYEYQKWCDKILDDDASTRSPTASALLSKYLHDCHSREGGNPLHTKDGCLPSQA